MQVTIDFGDGAGARDYSALVLEEKGLEVVRKLNAPSQLKLALLVGSAGTVAEPPLGADVEVVRSSGEKLFTGAVAEVSYEYLGWGEQGAVYAMQLLGLSSEANSKSAAIPGSLVETGGIAASAVLAAQAAGLSLAVANDGGITEAIELPVVEFGPETSAAEAIARVAAQSRLSYRVHDGQLRVVAVGAVQHAVSDAQSRDPRIVTEAQSGAAASKKKTAVTAVGRSEAQGYVVEYVGLDGRTDTVTAGRPMYDHESSKLFLDVFANGATALAVVGQTAAVVVSNGQMSVNATAGCTVAVGAPVECGGRVLLEVDGCAIAGAGAGALMGFFDASVAGDPAVGSCVAGFQITPNGGTAQVNGVIGGAVAGTAMAVNATSKYAFRVRMYAPAHVRKTQVYHSGKHRAGSGLGGRDVGSWIAAVCEATETLANGTTRVWVLGAQQSAASSSYANAVVVSGTSIAMTMGKVRVARGPAFDARYAAGGWSGCCGWARRRTGRRRGCIRAMCSWVSRRRAGTC